MGDAILVQQMTVSGGGAPDIYMVPNGGFSYDLPLVRSDIPKSIFISARNGESPPYRGTAWIDVGTDTIWRVNVYKNSYETTIILTATMSNNSWTKFNITAPNGAYWFNDLAFFY